MVASMLTSCDDPSMAEESKTELKEKLDRALATNTRERRKRENLEQDLVDTAFTIGGGLAAGVIAREFGPLGESSYDIPINLASGVLLALIGLAEWGGSISSELASFGIGQLTFQAGLFTYGEGYQADAAAGDDWVGYGTPKKKKKKKKNRGGEDENQPPLRWSDVAQHLRGY